MWHDGRYRYKVLITVIPIRCHRQNYHHTFIIVLEALSPEFRSGVPWEDLYADDLVIIAESLEECVRRLLTWKEAMQKKGLRVNAGKTKIMICGTGLDLLQSSVALEWAATASAAMAASTGCTRNAVGSSA